MSINCAVLMGRLTADPELKETKSGLSVTSFSIAVDRKYSKNGEKNVDFINVVAWRQTAEFICKYFAKGTMIAIEGYIQVRQYEDRNGNKRNAVEVVVDNASFCGGKNQTPAVSAPARETETVNGEEKMNDGLPF